ncbi:MAG: CcmD family protein [Gemmatimonadota bacterium]|jgi:CcmD family protein
MKRLTRMHGWGLSLVCALALAAPAVAQEAALPGSDAAGQSLRPYAFVFVAYAILWVFVFGWLVAVARRLARLERRLNA